MASWLRRDTTRPNRRVRPEIAIASVVIGSVTAAVGIGSAVAAPDYPSWDDVQNAKRDEAAAKAKIDELGGLLAGLQATADAAARAQQISAEKYQQAKVAAEAAVEVENDLTGKVAAANEKAKVSRMRAGLLAAHLARTGGGDFNLNMALDGQDSDNLLYQLGAMTKLSAGSQKIYNDAIADQKLASSLGEQAQVAATKRADLAKEAEAALASATSASQAAGNAVREQEARQGELIAQLALLKNTTVEAEAAYQQGLLANRPSTGGNGGGSTGGGAPAAGGNSGGGSGSGGGNSGGGGSSGGGSQPAPPPPPSNDSPGDPVADKVATAIAFARNQIGDMYQLGGAGPDRWDCSGLTLRAYQAAGVSIGSHSATNQYNTARSRGQLVPWSERQPGDLIFWTSGYDMYHVAIYTGGGMMIEAPSEGKPVRERSVWDDGSRYDWVARPTA